MSSLEEARRRWGEAGSHAGGGEASPRIDFSPWRNLSLQKREEEKSGIADCHFDSFLHVCQRFACVIVVRRGKYACVRWIKHDYPAKPSSVWKVKNSKKTGLVTCSSSHPEFSYEDQVIHAWEAGYYVLEHVPLSRRARQQSGIQAASSLTAESLAQGAGPFLHRGPRGQSPGSPMTPVRGRGPLCRAGKTSPMYLNSPGPLGRDTGADALSYYAADEICVTALQARCGGNVLPQLYPVTSFEVGQVIEPESMLPLTGDYDLMAVFPVDSPGSKNLVLVAGTDAEKNHEMEKITVKDEDGQPVNTLWLTKYRDNPYTDQIGKALNGAFGRRPRIMHGPHDLKFDVDDNNDEGCAVFTPEGAFFLPEVKDVKNFYMQIGRLRYKRDAKGRFAKGGIAGLPRPEKDLQ